jgi:hypothetical protein
MAVTSGLANWAACATKRFWSAKELFYQSALMFFNFMLPAETE